MSTLPDQYTPETKWGRSEGARFRAKAATTGLVALVTLRELARRRGALALATLLPLTFYLVRLETHWTAIRLLSIGLGWATATLALFTQVSSRSVDRRLVVSGARPARLLLGRCSGSGGSSASSTAASSWPRSATSSPTPAQCRSCCC